MSVKLKWGAKGGAKPQMGGHGPPGPPLGAATVDQRDTVYRASDYNLQS